MTPKALAAWMRTHGVTPVDMASALKISPDTVKRFLAGRNVHRSTQAAIDRFILSYKQFEPPKSS